MQLCWYIHLLHLHSHAIPRVQGVNPAPGLPAILNIHHLPGAILFNMLLKKTQHDPAGCERDRRFSGFTLLLKYSDLCLKPELELFI